MSAPPVEHYADNGPWIQTRYGRFHADFPKFDVADISHALGMIVRFNGHVSHFYSVAEHTLLVSRLMQDVTGGDPFEGLMHDATEAYLSDVPSPFKQKLLDLKAWDHQMETAMRKQFNLTETITPECKHADWLALGLEAHYLMSDGGKDYYYPPGIREEVAKLVASEEWGLHCLQPTIASHVWVQRYKELSKVINGTATQIG